MFEEGKTARVARSLMSKVNAIYKKHPTMRQTVLMIEHDIITAMERIKDELTVLNRDDANMVTVSIINDIHQKVDEIFLSDFSDDDDEEDEED